MDSTAVARVKAAIQARARQRRAATGDTTPVGETHAGNVRSVPMRNDQVLTETPGSFLLKLVGASIGTFVLLQLWLLGARFTIEGIGIGLMWFGTTFLGSTWFAELWTSLGEYRWVVPIWFSLTEILWSPFSGRLLSNVPILRYFAGHVYLWMRGVSIICSTLDLVTTFAAALASAWLANQVVRGIATLFLTFGPESALLWMWGSVIESGRRVLNATRAA